MARQKSSLNKNPLIPESPSKRKMPTSENSLLEAVHHIKKVGKQAHLQAEKTQKAYEGHIHQRCEWLQSHTDSSSTTPTRIVEDIYNNPVFKDAFEKLPNHCSDKALALYLSWRGFHENQSQNTVEGVDVAFKKLWDRNPATFAKVDDVCCSNVMASIKHKVTMERSDCMHSSAMKKEYMDKILTWLITTCLELETWIIWTRCFELVKLKQEDIQIMDVTLVNHVLTKYLRGKQGTLITNERDIYYEIHLRNQKGWQKKLILHAIIPDAATGNHYKIYLRPDLTSCDLFFWLMVWVRQVEHIHLGQAMVDGNFIFPAIGANSVLKPCEPISQDAVQKWIRKVTTGARIEGTFTTHLVQWWGGWADGEHHDTLIHYLLDELHSYENDHSNALGPFPCEADMSLAGEHTLAAPATREELWMFQMSVSMEIHNLDNNIQAILGNVTNSLQDLTQVVCSGQLSIVASSLPPPSGTDALGTFTTECTALLMNLQTFTTHSSAPPAILALRTNHLSLHYTFPQPSATSLSLVTAEGDTLMYSLPSPFIPNVLFTHTDGIITLRSQAWKDIIQHWEEGVLEKRLLSLKDWPYEYTHGPNCNLQSKYNQWHIIALEFLNLYKGDEKKFIEAYESNIQKRITSLLHAITATHQQQDEAEI
ncbi:hypothetical protein V8B97DRAFT_2022770 [Scleroderma yunnanense]